MKQAIRFFSLGIIVATITIGTAYWLGLNESSESSTTMAEKDMIQEIEKSNYYVLTEEELQEQINNALAAKKDSEDKESSKETENKEPAEEETDEQSNEDEPVPYTLVIEEGVSSTEISQILEQEGIIDNADSFETYMADRNLTQYIQIGEFELNQSMNRDEVADAITQ
ncbi:endolytic transglycosylase MltG [Halobacillus sp. Marseille-P3879]|uniref:endolytic transglycosylase MltG n=1 Tax=Halobacillus sp. Marseille-P3879 TaxID=2045014 RepID=UPI000C7DD395|nr:endolytic transglycosylase MltG [Halobacillus sp. Marseille-P3879]